MQIQCLSKKYLVAFAVITYLALSFTSGIGGELCIIIGNSTKSTTADELKCQVAQETCNNDWSGIKGQRAIPVTEECTECFDFSFQQITLASNISSDIKIKISAPVNIVQNFVSPGSSVIRRLRQIYPVNSPRLMSASPLSVLQSVILII